MLSMPALHSAPSPTSEWDPRNPHSLSTAPEMSNTLTSVRMYSGGKTKVFTFCSANVPRGTVGSGKRKGEKRARYNHCVAAHLLLGAGCSLPGVEGAPLPGRPAQVKASCCLSPGAAQRSQPGRTGVPVFHSPGRGQRQGSASHRADSGNRTPVPGPLLPPFSSEIGSAGGVCAPCASSGPNSPCLCYCFMTLCPHIRHIFFYCGEMHLT